MARSLVYCGTYTDPSRQAGFEVTPDKPVMGMTGLTGSDGIYVFEHDPDSGELRHTDTVTEVVNPSYLTLDGGNRFLFAVNEVRDFHGEATGAVSSFVIDQKTGVPQFESQVPSGGGNPCHLAVSPCGRYLLVANHEAGSVAVFPVDEQGRLSPLVDLRMDEPTDDSGRRRPHAHFVTPDPTGAFVFSSDTGTDRIMIYKLDVERGHLVPNDPAWGETHQGGSPRHITFDLTGRFMYANGEADLTLSVFRVDANGGQLDHIQHLPTVPSGIDTQGHSTAHILAHPNGRFVYVSNRGDDSVAIFRIDDGSGRATRLAIESTRGKTPRNFAIDPSGRFLYVANQNSDSIECFNIHQPSGFLTHSKRVACVPAPTCLVFTRI